jgi:hypothetical protein
MSDNSDNSDSPNEKSEKILLKVAVSSSQVQVTQLNVENCVHDVRDEVAQIDGSSPEWTEVRQLHDAFNQVKARIEAKLNSIPERIRAVVRKEIMDSRFVHGDDYDEY